MRVEIPPDRPTVILQLPGGRDLTLVPFAPDDRGYLEEGLSELSLESRFSRFGQGLDHLSERELSYLSDVDQQQHVAWAAVLDHEGVGVGRYIITGDGTADVAVTVVDHHQGTGVGTALFSALVAVAQHDGVPGFRVSVVPTNRRVVEWAESLGVRLIDSGGLLEGEFPLAGLEVPDADRFVETMQTYRGSTPVPPPGPETPS